MRCSIQTESAHAFQPHRIRRRGKALRRIGLQLDRVGACIVRKPNQAGSRVDIAFMVSPGTDSQIAEVTAAVGKLARVDRLVCLGVLD